MVAVVRMPDDDPFFGPAVRGLHADLVGEEALQARRAGDDEGAVAGDVEPRPVAAPPIDIDPATLTHPSAVDQGERIARELFGQLATENPDFLEALTHAFVSQSRVEKSSEPAETYTEGTSAVSQALAPIGYALRTYAAKFPDLFPEGFDAKLWGLRLTAANAYLGAIKHGLTGYTLIQAYRYRSDIEEMLGRLEQIHAEAQDPELKAQVGHHVEELRYWLEQEKRQWREQAIVFGFNFTSDMSYLVRWTKELQGVTIATDVKNAIWGYSLIVSLPQKGHAVYKIEKKARREKAWSQEQKKGAGVLTPDEAGQAKVRAWLEREWEKMGVLEEVKAEERYPVEQQEPADAILTSEMRHKQALSTQTRNVLRTAAQQKQRIYHDMVAYERKRAWVNLAIGVMSATAWLFTVLGVMAGTVTVLTTTLPILGIALLLVGFVYSYRQQPNLFKLYLSRVGVRHFFTQLLPMYGVKIKKGWHEWRLGRREGELAQQLELRQAVVLMRDLSKLPMHKRPQWANQALTIAYAAIQRGMEEVESEEELQALLETEGEKSDLEKLTEKLASLDERVEHYEETIRETPMTRYGGSWAQRKAQAHWSDFLKVARRKGIAAANQAQSGEIIAESLAEMISEGFIDDETKELLRLQLGILLPLDPSPDQEELTVFLTKKIKSFLTMNPNTYGGLVQQRVRELSAS